MNVKINIGRHVLVLAVLSGLTLLAPMTWSQSKGPREHEGKTVTITGCMTKGESADEFAITHNGKKYGLKSTRVRLAEHLGHKVTVTGKFTREPGEGEEEEKGEEGGGEYADVQVMRLKLISTSCH